MSYDVAQLRSHFPSLRSGIAHFDGPGGTQTPREVGEAVATTLTGPLSNRGTGVLSERNADEATLAFRAAMSDFLGVPPEGVVFGRSATQLTMDFSRALAKAWGPGDEVVVSRLDHDGNVRPWIIAAEAGGRDRPLDRLRPRDGRSGAVDGRGGDRAAHQGRRDHGRVEHPGHQAAPAPDR
ncbi:MAG: aminotransferase class V-fold PLP-dependent enzyme [Chloroflexota bacterium]